MKEFTCTICKENGRQYGGHGMCGRCYQYWMYHNNPTHRENVRRGYMKYWKKNPWINEENKIRNKKAYWEKKKNKVK